MASMFCYDIYKKNMTELDLRKLGAIISRANNTLNEKDIFTIKDLYKKLSAAGFHSASGRLEDLTDEQLVSVGWKKGDKIEVDIFTNEKSGSTSMSFNWNVLKGDTKNEM